MGYLARRSGILTYLFAGALLLASAAQAATITVTITTDENDGSCTDGDCSLRDAVATAASGDTVSVPAGTFVLTLGQIAIVNRNLTVQGAGARDTALDGNAASRIFRISSSGSSTSVVIQDVTITNTRPTDGLGGVYAEKAGTDVSLTLARCTMSENAGSAVGVFGGSLIIDRCTISNNGKALSVGGAVLLSASSLQLTNSTISNNQEDTEGVLASNSTIDVLNSTFADNQGNNLALLPGSTANLFNTILSSTPGEANCFGGTASGTGNLDSDNSCGLGVGNLLSVDPLIGSLADNGGPTDTRTLLEGSPAIDAGDDSQCLAIDQIGTARPQGPGCDIGAVEIEVATNEPPVCAGATANPGTLTGLLLLGQFVPIQVTGVSDPDGDTVTITVTSIFQDEPVSELILGLLTSPDGVGITTSNPQVRAERRLLLLSNGRVYHIGFTADDGNGGTCSGDVTVKVPPLLGPTVDNGPSYNSTVP